jgi:hypothetical protein
MTRRLAALGTILLLAQGALAQDVALKSERTRWRLTIERLDLDRENLGLVGAHYDVLEPFSFLPGVYTGIGGFAAVTGRSGGFFTGGVTLGYLREVIESWNVDVGVFAGAGGGGGGTGRTDGLFLRPHFAIEREIGLVAVRAEAAFVEYGPGEFDDLHLALGISLPSESLQAREGSRGRHIPAEAIAERRLRVAPSYLLLDTGSDDSLRGGGGFDDLQMVGVNVDYFVNEWLFFPVGIWGAVNGDVAGFGLALAGFGVSLPLFADGVRLEAKAMAGAGGGGDVDTGGGFGWQGMAGLHASATSRVGVSLMAGLTDFPDGDFDATTLSAGLTWTARSPELRLDYPRSRLLQEGLSTEDVDVSTTRFQVLNKTYVPDGSAKRTDGRDLEDTIQLIGLGVEQPITSWLSVTAKGYGAYLGDAGGYGELLGGLRYELRPFADERHAFSAAAEAGAAGGGGVDVGSGLLYQFTGGYRWQFSDQFSLYLEAGYAEADRGSFEAVAYQVGLAWSLQRAWFR